MSRRPICLTAVRLNGVISLALALAVALALRLALPLVFALASASFLLAGSANSGAKIASWAQGRPQVAAKAAPEPPLDGSWSALGGSWSRLGALLAPLGAVWGRSPEAPREAVLEGVFGGLRRETEKATMF